MSVHVQSNNEHKDISLLSFNLPSMACDLKYLERESFTNNLRHDWNSCWKWEACYWLRSLVQLLPHFLPSYMWVRFRSKSTQRWSWVSRYGPCSVAGKWLATTSLQALCITEKGFKHIFFFQNCFHFSSSSMYFSYSLFQCELIIKSMPVGAWSVAMAESMCCSLVVHGEK